jgi:uncharacterized protein YpuA (DUF1002 family)
LDNIIFYAVGLVISIIAFLCGKYVFPSLKNNEIISDITSWVYKFVVSAKNQFGDNKGKEKLAYVTEQVNALCEKYKINLTDEQIRALIESAYDAMKQAQKEVKETK